MRVALSVACFDDALSLIREGRDRPLERLGHEVVFPPGQTCCGQIHWTVSYHREAADLARAYTAAFEGGDVVVAPSASCTAAVRDAYPRIARAARDPAWPAPPRPRRLRADRVPRGRPGVTDVGAYFPHRVTYHPSCQSLRSLRVGDRPLRLLRAVQGLDLVELPAADECCGFGGAFAMKNADVSVAMVADKVRHIRGTGADVVCAVDDSCLAHIGGALSRLRPASGPCTWPRSSRRRGRRDRRAAGRARPAADAEVRRRGTARAGRHRPAPQPARRDRRPPRAGGRRVRRARRLGGPARGSRAIGDDALRNLDVHLEELERAVTEAGGTVHWAADAAEARRIVTGLVRAVSATEVVKSASLAVREIGLDGALVGMGVTVRETALADLAVQLGEDEPSHLLSPAAHRDRAQIRELFRRGMPAAGPDLPDDPGALAAAARAHLREPFLRARVAITGANFLVAESGTAVVVESEGNARMCLTLPETLICVAGIDKVVPAWDDMEVFLQLLPRSSTGDRMTLTSRPGRG